MTSPVRWPDDLGPDSADLHAVNTLDTALPPERIWPWLLRADRWGEFYANCKRLRFADGRGPALALGVRFHWWTFGVPVTTVIEELEPGERLAWRGRGLGAVGYHAWVLERTATGTRLVTEEVQRGWVPRLFRPLFRRGLLHFHQRWLEGLVHMAEQGHPDEIASRTGAAAARSG